MVGDIQVGVLDCETLEGAEDATMLLVATSPAEVGSRKPISRHPFERKTTLHVFDKNMLTDITLLTTDHDVDRASPKPHILITHGVYNYCAVCLR